MKTFNFTDIENKQEMTKTSLLNYITTQMKNKLNTEFENVSNSGVGQIIISCVKLDPNIYIELDGRLLIKEFYPDLFNVYQHKFETDHNQTFDKDVYFALPDCRTRALIMQDADGVLDQQLRPIGSNLDWRLNLDKLLDFDLSRQITLVKNVSEQSETNNEYKNNYSLIKSGISSKTYIIKESKDYTLKDKNGEFLQTKDKLQFDSIYLYFYTKFGRNLTPQT